jgi:hypothetical protein
VARRLDLALLDAAADLHAVDATAAGLGDLGRPEGLRTTAGRWLARPPSARPSGVSRAGAGAHSVMPSLTYLNGTLKEWQMITCPADLGIVSTSAVASR